MSAPPRLYTRHFFQLLAALVAYMTGLSLQCHFGKYIAHLGGTESTLGWVTGIGMLGSLLARPRIGRWVDRLGTKPMMVAGSCTAGLVVLGFQFTDHLVLAAALRVGLMLSTATFFTSVASYAALIAPPRRRAESLGTLGMGGFMGMMLGPALGDWVFAHPLGGLSPFTVFFVASAAAYWISAGLMLPLPPPPLPHDEPAPPGSFWRALRTHWPGMILLVGASFTLAQTIPIVYLERFAEARHIPNIRNFYFGYAATAIVLRLVFRRLPELFGRRRTLLMGFALMAGGFLLLPTAWTETQLFLPAMVLGAGHCFIYPSMVDLAATKFPPLQRGLGTSIILGAGDLGMLTGFILWGQIITRVGYPTTFVICAGWLLLVAGLYAYRQRTVIFRRTPLSQ